MTLYVVGIGAICLLVVGAFVLAEGVSPREGLRLLISRWKSGERL